MNSSMRVALISAFPPGTQSLNEYGLHLAKGLADREDVSEVIVIADMLEDDAPELELDPKINIKRCWGFNKLSALPKILTALRAEAPDGVVWNVQAASFGDKEIPAGLGLMGPWMARMMGLPNGVIAHNIIAGVDLNSTHLSGQPLRQALVRNGGRMITRAMLQANYTTVTLRNYQNKLLTDFPNAPVELIPHGTFDTEDRDLSPLKERPQRIVTMGKFGTYKKLETLLAAFDMLRLDPRFENLELHVGGTDHPNAPGYLKTLTNSRIDDPQVQFKGYIAEEDVAAFFENARMSVFDYETTTGSSGVLHQTASYGAVPVFPHIGDFVDLCRDEGLTGGNYAPSDARSLAAVMAELLCNVEAAQSIANKNLEMAKGMPFSDVVAFHVRKLRSLSKKPVVRSATKAWSKY